MGKRSEFQTHIATMESVLFCTQRKSFRALAELEWALLSPLLWPCPGIYIYARETSPHKWILHLHEQTENLNVRLKNHEQQEMRRSEGATHIHIGTVTNEKSSLTLEKDLIEQSKPVCNTQFERIAEEVAQANPDVVVRDEKGEAYTVHYEAANATLLSEFLKEHRKVQEQDAIIAQLKKDFQATIARQQKQIELLTVGLEKVSARLEASKPAPQVVKNP